MTLQQKQEARKRVKFELRNLTTLAWLIEKNEEWKQKNINLNEVRADLRSPVFVNSSTVESGKGDSNIESTESF